ncbi:Receptor-like serine/threonine-protein kinase [Heracleum sosnowskyi]|uniref:Receptor-like serine/threonine-protein kinase n=1 Tax=Heracleum sosnowskyi TaxID=360622 RepID=A0AAD8HCC0_9APIA|nr:Receptor-like serine/threonine-protein kinase [Heracleum sosnowskyi]
MLPEKNSLCFFFILLLASCTSTSIITLDKPLSDGHILLSARQKFALGFFSPTNSSRRYVGIWYNKVSVQTVIWVANRDSPITNASGVLSLHKSGNLVLVDSQKPDAVVWSTNISNLLESNYSAELLDSGNFVLREDNSNKGLLWQSSDFPTDALISNMKIGVDRRSGLNRFLTAWKSPDDPGSGSYTIMINANGSVPQLFLYRDWEPIWRGGPWNGYGWSGVPEMAVLGSSRFIFNVCYVDNPDEVYLVDYLRNTSVISRMIANETTGTLQRITWQEGDHKWLDFYSAPKDICDHYSHCGPYSVCNIYNVGEYECNCPPGFKPKAPRDWFLRDGSQGCVRIQKGQICGNGEGFVKLKRMKLPDTSKAIRDMNLGMKACAGLCLKNCSCMGYSAADVRDGGSKGCITWYSELVDLREFSSGGQDFYMRLDAAELAKYSKKSKRFPGFLKILFFVLLSAAILVLLGLAYWFKMKRTKAKARRKQEEGLFSSNSNNLRTSVNDSPNRDEVDNLGTSTGDVKFYSLTTIIAATENFSLAHKVGEGGFGSVYKGKLEDGQEIAVKRLSNTSGQGIEEFRNEVTLIARLQHRNLVRLYGYCIQKNEKMLVYEYLPNKGLDCFLFDKEKKCMLDWAKRFDITLGIARGMVYLHHDSRLRIIHRDLKASNVLLDAQMNPKISDFGMARIFGSDQNEEMTRRVVGTYGYMSPEYAMEGLFSIKSDVFSFGILLLEIIMGRKNSTYYAENSVNLIGHVWDLWGKSRALEIVDPSLGTSHEREHEIHRCIHIALLCVQESATARPSMSEVVFMLCNETSLPPPDQAAFILRTSDKGLANTSSSSVGANSVNDITITTVEGR